MFVLALLVHVKCSGGWVQPRHVALNLRKIFLTALYGGTGDQVVCTPIQFGALLAPTQGLQILVLHPHIVKFVILHYKALALQWTQHCTYTFTLGELAGPELF